VDNSQTDGADDWDVMVAERRAAALQSGCYDADMTIRQQVEQMGQSMEGGGLMMTMAEREKLPNPRKKRRVVPEPEVADGSSSVSDMTAAHSARPSPTIPQYDGNLDDSDEDDKTGVKNDPDPDLDDEDEDAINSDLDDPDDNVVADQDEDGNAGEIMLCTYDKVQRVKNKWKCTLKDGVLTTGGKEYVFHKAQGEFEW